MRRRTTILTGTGLAILVAAVLVWLLRPKHVEPADAVKVLGVVREPKVGPGTNLWAVAVVVSNIGASTVQVVFPTLQICAVDGWTNVAEAIDLRDNYASELGPHGCATQTIVYVATRPDSDWRLRFLVSEKVHGLNRYFVKRPPMMYNLRVPNRNPNNWGPIWEVVSPVYGASTGTNKMAAVR